jgi:hypothetical protein
MNKNNNKLQIINENLLLLLIIVILKKLIISKSITTETNRKWYGRKANRWGSMCFLKICISVPVES